MLKGLHLPSRGASRRAKVEGDGVVVSAPTERASMRTEEQRVLTGRRGFCLLTVSDNNRECARKA